MKKNRWPWRKWFPRDFISDSALKMCSPATKGIYVLWICHMMDMETSKIRATLAHFAKLGECRIKEAETALAELKATNAAPVTLGNDFVTLVSRRLQREEKARENTRKRVQRYRSNSDVTPEKRDRSQKSEVRSQSTEIRLEYKIGLEARARASAPKLFPKTEQEARELAASANCTEAFAAEVWREAVENKFRDRNDVMIRNFPAFLAACEMHRAKRQAESQPKAKPKKAAAPSPEAPKKSKLKQL